MGAAGEDIADYLMKKYGCTAEQFERNRETLRARGAALGFDFQMSKRDRVYNTFDAHRMLHWAELEGRQQALKHALFAAYFCAGKNPSDHEALIEIAAEVGLDRARARQILTSGEFAKEVRQRERFYLEQGIHAVPALILNERYLVQGAQPVDVVERTIRQIAASGSAI
jgi:predicted DsbA family dithiol-disulfide isomerase